MAKIDLRDVVTRIDIDEGRYAVLVDISLDRADAVRNIFMLDNGGKLIWQVHSDFDNEPGGYFTRIEYQERILRGHRFDGIVYTIDLATGRATPERVVK